MALSDALMDLYFKIMRVKKEIQINKIIAYNNNCRNPITYRKDAFLSDQRPCDLSCYYTTQRSRQRSDVS